MEKNNRAAIAKGYKKTFLGATEVLQDLESFCHGNTPSFVAGDPHATSYHEGQRSVLNRIKYFLAVDPKTLEETRG